MKIRRFTTIAALGLAMIRPTRADEPGVARVAYTTEHVRASGRAIVPVIEAGGQAIPATSPTQADAALGMTNAQRVSDYPSQLTPGKGSISGPGAGPISPQAPWIPGPASPQAPGVPAPPVEPSIPTIPPGQPGPVPPPSFEPTPVPPIPSDIEPAVPPTPIEPTAPIEPAPAAPTPPAPSLPSEIPPPVIPAPGGTATELPPPSLPTDIPTPAFPEAAPSPAPVEAIAPDALAGGLGAGAAGGTTSFAALAAQGSFPTPEVFGDALSRSVMQIALPRPQPPPPLPRPPVPPRPPSPFQPVLSAAFVPTIQNIKLSENQSPAPRNRLIYQFNYYDSVNESINNRFLSPISNIRVYRHIFGFEKTLFDQRASIGMRLPLNTVSADSPLPNVGQTETALGNLEIFTKYVLYADPDAGRLLSTGFAISPSTGPGRFAGANYLPDVNNTTIQPFLGGIFTAGNFFLQGFLSIEVPFAERDVTILYNDYAFGYFLYRSADPNRWLTAITPTFEVHVNTPLNHRGVSITDPLGTPDFVNLTYGTAFDFGRRTRFLAAFVTPVTGPRPFAFEVIASLNIYY